MGERRGAYRALVEKPEGTRPFGRPRRIWEDNIKIDLREVGRGGGGHVLDQYGTGKGHVTGSSECGNEPSVSVKFGEFPD
jgi:hypothetical protein